MNNYSVFNHTKLIDFISSNQIATPCYIYDDNLLDDTFAAARKALDKNFKKAVIHYAIKANHNSEILKYVKKHGMGVDCVSGNEILRALENGIAASDIVFAGVGKADWEIDLALKSDIFAFNCESAEEVCVLNDFALAHNKTANICLRINPNIDAQTHKYISTGQFDDKFGISMTNAEMLITTKLDDLKNINVIGLHYHVGSQIVNYDVFRELAETANRNIIQLSELGVSIKHINFGGGVGVDYDNPRENPIVCFDTFFSEIAANFSNNNNLTVHFELGRSLVSQAGVLLSKVLLTKKTQDTNFAIIDAGMTELIRPALYDAQHKVESVGVENEQMTLYHIVGPICECSDTFAKGLVLPKLKRGDLIAIYSTGAYGKVLSSEYNLRPTVKEYFINRDYYATSK